MAEIPWINLSATTGENTLDHILAEVTLMRQAQAQQHEELAQIKRDVLSFRQDIIEAMAALHKEIRVLSSFTEGIDRLHQRLALTEAACKETLRLARQPNVLQQLPLNASATTHEQLQQTREFNLVLRSRFPL